MLRYGTWEVDVLHEDRLEEEFWVVVVEGQASTHHLIHDHSCPPPVHCSAVVTVLQHLQVAVSGSLQVDNAPG